MKRVNKPLAITVVSNYFPAHGGGVELVAARLVDEFIRKHATVHWFAADDSSTSYSKASLTEHHIQSFNVLEAKTGIPFPLWVPFGFVSLRREICCADIVHLHDYLYPACVAAFFIAKFLAKPVYITQHIGFIPYKNWLARTALHLVNRTLGLYMLRRAKGVAFISNSVMNYFSNFGGAPVHWIYAANGVDTCLFSPSSCASDKSRYVAMWNLPTGVSLVLFVGRFVEKKGLGLLRKLISTTPNLQWIMVGKGPIQPLDWQLPNLLCISSISQEQLRDHYRAADLLVLPSVGEGYPLVIQEAMACGTPCLTTFDTALGCLPALPLLYTEKSAGEEQNNVESWKRHLLGILENGAERVERGKRCHRFAIDHWSWEANADRYLQIFSS